MNDWTKFIEKWFNESQIAFSDYEFDIMKQELLLGCGELTEDFDRVFNDDLYEMGLSESYIGMRRENVSKELFLLHGSYPLNVRPKRRKIKLEKVSNPSLYKEVLYLEYK